MAGASSRRPPWPDDLKIGAYGLRLVDGTLIGRKTQSLENVAPTTQEYDSAPVYKERTFAFKPTRGMGERIQSSHTSRRYPYGLNVWVIGGLFGKGPLTHTITPASTGSVRDFIDALAGGLLSQFILAGQYVLKRNGDANGDQAVSKDFGGGKVAMSAVRFRGAYATPIDGLYVAVSDGTIWQFDGAAWNATVLPAGFLPQYLEVLNSQMWAADPTNSTIRAVSGDPLLAGSYGGQILIGNPSIKITSIKKTGGFLAIFKEDGSIYYVDGTGAVFDPFPDERLPLDPANGANAAGWLETLWTRRGVGFYQVDLRGPSLTSIGPERMLNDASELRGPVQCFAGYETIGAFAITYNGTNSYLLQYGNWIPPNEIFSQQNAVFQFADQYDGAVVKWTSKQATAMRISGISGGGVTRLFVGFSDGTFDWIKLVPNPFAPSSGAEFTLGTSKMYAPLHHAMFQADWKTTNGFSVFGPLLNTNDYAQISYRMDGSTAAYTALGGNLNAPGKRLDTPDGTVGHLLDVEISLTNATTADTPIIEGIGIHESVRPALKRDFSGSIDARSRCARRDGSVSRLTAEQIRDVVLQAAGAPGAVTLTMPDEVAQSLSFFGYQETLVPRTQRNGRAWQIDFQATEFNTMTVYGTVGRMKGVLVGDLAGVLVIQLKTW